MNLAYSGPAMIAVGMPIRIAYSKVCPTEAWKACTASIAAGCGGTSACTTESPATIGSPTIRIDTPTRRAMVKAMGTSSTKPTSKNNGSPTRKAMHTIAQ
ncbi:hypothetical protein D3C76_1479140 [compost metagenome]